MQGLRRLADNRRAGSMADRFRRRRFALFRLLLDAVPVPADGRRLRILDVGGTPTFWEPMGLEVGSQVEIVLLNLTEQEVPHEHIRAVVGNAVDMSMFADGEFDIVLSNSVIEHLPSLELQSRMSAEVRRVGRRHWVQTPDRRFPLEPHFLFPFFQYLPVKMRVGLLRRMDLGWYPRQPDPAAARAEVVSVRLMSHRELRDLFPGSQIIGERAFGLRKSFVVIGGWEGRLPTRSSLPAHRQRRDWDEVGSLDPLWAILSAPEKRHGEWDIDEFFDTGRREIAGVLARGADWGLPVKHEHALDFGCGVGRLTRALAAHFDSSLGVDLSEVMVSSARRLHADTTNPSFRTLADAPLSGMPNQTFDFIYSNLVLQHMRDHRAIEATVVDFVRLLRPGGMLVFQLPSDIPRRRRIQARPRLYTALRALGVPHTTLYERLGLHPIRMTGIAEPKVARLLVWAGGTVLAVDRRVLAHTGIQDRTFYVTVT